VHEPLVARQLASKILDYERNLSHQRDLFVKQFDSLVTNSGVETGGRSLFADELDMMDDYMEEQRIFKRPIAKKDLNFVMNAKRKIQKLWSKVDAREQRERAREAMNSVRYLKRASNQLIKSLKALRPA
jgi:hypothetical protein